MIGPMDDAHHLRHATRLALRGHGGAEPNPMVGCVLVSQDNTVVGWGCHRRCGEAHAEINALHMAGQASRGATAYVTLEPCTHTGRTGPCARALIDAGISRVVIARRDPHPEAGGGAAMLREAGIDVMIADEVERPITPAMRAALSIAQRVSDPFIHRVRTGLPWVTVKWAQSLDGSIATRTGESQWISNPTSRRMVHRERGRVDAILTGIGTALSDDPKLTARHVRIRRQPRRIVVDEQLAIGMDRHLVTHAQTHPTTLLCTAAAASTAPDKVNALRNAGVDVLPLDGDEHTIDLNEALQVLSSERDIATILVEAGPGLVSRLMTQRLVNELWVFIAPLALGDDLARSCLTGMTAQQLTDGVELSLLDHRRRGDDIVLRYRIC